MKWLHNATNDEWEATTSEWRLRAYPDAVSDDWYGVIERLVAPHDRHASAACDSAMDARKWCQAELTYWASKESS